MNNWTKILTRPYIVLALGAVLGAVVVTTIEKPIDKSRKLNFSPVQTTVSNGQSVTDGLVLGELNEQYIKLSDYVSSAVVHITITAKNPLGEGEQSIGDGSGFIMTPDGWIVTNDHVVKGKTEVTVILADGREFKGKVLVTGDQDLDIAMVKIESNDLPTLKFSDSDNVKPGQIVIAAGSPFGLENSITFGHVSAIGRPGMAGDGRSRPRLYRGMIQTDASINPGNSGGPLVSIEGEVVGVNTSIFSTTGASAGIGFAYPSNMVQVIADELIKTGKFDRGMMGLAPRDLKPFEAKAKKLSGAYVEQIIPGDPAEKAGLKVGDIITRIGEYTITNETDLRVSMIALSPNDKVDITYVRDGKSNSTNLVLKAPTFPKEQAPTPQLNREQAPFGVVPPELRDFFQGQERARRPSLGVTLYDVDDTTREQYGLPGGLEGAIVESIRDGSLASNAGLKRGDVITSVNGTKIKTGEEVVHVMNKLTGQEKATIKFVRMQEGKAIEKTVVISF